LPFHYSILHLEQATQLDAQDIDAVMQVTSLLRSLLAAIFVLTLAPEVIQAHDDDECDCGTDHPSAEEIKAMGDAVVQEKSLARTDNVEARALNKIHIETYMHVIVGSNGDGMVSQQMLDDAITELNNSYGNTRFAFYLKASTCTVSDELYGGRVYRGTALEKNMKRSLHQGGAASLNVYLLAFNSTRLAGYALTPWQARGARDMDGIVLASDTLPGGNRTHYNTGKTLVHEVGHWVGGLMHTFSFYAFTFIPIFGPLIGCMWIYGDQILDTPANIRPSGNATGDCRKYAGRDSCWLWPGKDPIHNHMNYHWDECKTDDFTGGQKNWMQTQWNFFRSMDYVEPATIPPPPAAPLQCPI
jgi:hypothetical protein